jgi:serine/threonine-protein kinase
MTDIRQQVQEAVGSTYHIERELGGGGMSRVFVATETVLGREVVIKVLAPELAEGLNVERFRREIQLAARLQHPHIVPLLAAGEAGRLPFFTMPFIQGESLRARLARGGELPIGDAVRLLREVATALAYAHAHGVVHRDIKPDNVLVSGGSAMVTDFGVAKALDAAAHTTTGHQLTQLGVALGTPAYMAPEQAAADPATDHRADLYAFGAMAYELLSGEPPFTGRPTQALLAAHAVETPESIARRRPAVAGPLADLIMRCLEKRPADRPQTADEIVRALDGVPISSATVHATAIRVPAATRRWTPFVALLLVVLAVAGATGMWFRHRPAGGPLHHGQTMLAVLPFENDGPSADAYFADGLTEAITNRLASVHTLGVIDRRSASQYKGTDKSLKQIGRELGVQYVLEGTVRWANDTAGGRRVQITPTLVSTADLTTKPAGGPYVVVPSDVFQVQTDVATKVADALTGTLDDNDRRMLHARPTRNPDAYDAYMRGAELSDQDVAQDPRITRAAIDEYQRATKLDPRFALAFARLGEEDMQWAAYDLSDGARLTAARAAIDSALVLDPSLPEAHQSNASYERFFDHDYTAASAELARALALRPNDADVIGAMGTLQLARGQTDSGFANLATSVRLDPRSLEVLNRAAFQAANYRRFAEADDYANRMIAIAPQSVAGYNFKANIDLEGYGDTARARRLLDSARAVMPQLPLWLATDLADLGPADRAALERMSPNEMSVITRDDTVAYYIAKADLFLGRDPARVRAYGDSILVIGQRIKPGGPIAVERDIVEAFGDAFAGRRADADHEITVVKQHLGSDPNFLGQGTLYVAMMYAAEGNADSTVAELRQVLTLPTGVTAKYLPLDPAYTLVRGSPAFQALLAGH